MADERCPMCGKLNPDDLEVCQYCQARLKPLNISTPEEGQSEITPSSASFDETPSKRKLSDQTPALPDWLQPDWLQSLRKEGGTDELDELEPEDEQPDWSLEEAPEAEQGQSLPPEEGSEGSDWLESFRASDQAERETPVEEVPEQSPPEEEPGEQIPDWLQRVRARQSADEPEVPSEGEDAESAEFLANLRMPPPASETAPTEGEGVEPFHPEPAEGDVQVPDWLADFAEADSEGPPPELPDWLKSDEIPAFTDEGAESIADLPSQTPPSQPPFTQPFFEEEGAFVSPTEPPGAMPPPSTPFTEPIEGEGAEEEVPDWLAEMEQPSEGEKKTPPPFEGEQAEDQPDWLKDLEIKSGIAPKEEQDTGLEVVAPFAFDEESAELVQEEMPDWIMEIPPVETPPGEGGAPQEADADLEPAELPNWLEAMRPVEAVAPLAPLVDKRDQTVESSGPLAGFQGILPAEPEIAQEKKSPVYSVKLQVSESQQSHAARLTEVVKTEGIAVPIPRAPTISTLAVGRITLFLILLASIVWPVLSGDFGVPTPELPTEIIDAQLLINAIPDGGNVLMAVDYQPGFTGEMNATSASLLDHLMIKGVYLTMVSTSTSGPALAERLVHYVNTQMGHQYQDTDQYANLGYIGGGLSGLRNFAESPQQIMPYALNAIKAEDSTVWINGHLSDIQTLSDFDLCVVITESSETARNWIEQVGPALTDTPLLLVVSAQAEPLVRPYFESYPKQVKGMVVGLSGGVSYESSMPRPGLARRFWDAYSYALPTAVFLILIGGLVNIGLAYLPTLKPGQGTVKR